MKLLSEVPCGSEFSHCKFIKDAYESEEKIHNVKIIISDLISGASSIEEETVKLNPKEVDSHLSKYNIILQKLEEHKSNIAKEKLVLQEGKTETVKLKNEIRITKHTKKSIASIMAMVMRAH